jgi:hypothetical protein
LPINMFALCSTFQFRLTQPRNQKKDKEMDSGLARSLRVARLSERSGRAARVQMDALL